ncbi:hypothetical protein GCM10009596_09200 [Arthrobacter rhombi]
MLVARRATWEDHSERARDLVGRLPVLGVAEGDRGIVGWSGVQESRSPGAQESRSTGSGSGIDQRSMMATDASRKNRLMATRKTRSAMPKT